MKKILLSLLFLASAQAAFAYDVLSEDMQRGYVRYFTKELSNGDFGQLRDTLSEEEFLMIAKDHIEAEMGRRRVRQGAEAFTPEDIGSVVSLVFEGLGLGQDEEEAQEPLGWGSIVVRNLTGKRKLIRLNELFSFEELLEALRPDFGDNLRLIGAGKQLHNADEVREYAKKNETIFVARRDPGQDQEQPDVEELDPEDEEGAPRDEVADRILGVDNPESLAGGLNVLGLDAEPTRSQLRRAYRDFSPCLSP